MIGSARAAASAAAALAMGWATPTHAELRQTAERLAQTWRADGAYVVVDRTRFLNDDEIVPLVLPPLPEPSGAACTTVVLIGARGLGFHASLGESAAEAGRIASEAGTLSIERCGEPMPRRILVTADSGRGAVETVVARSGRPLRSAREALPERAAASARPGPEPGYLPTVLSPASRAERVEVRGRRDGATVLARTTWEAAADGSGRGAEVLRAGCHTLGLHAPDPLSRVRAGRGKLDLDAEMRDTSHDRLLARDRSDAPDARLAVCVGEDTPVEVAFLGAPPGSPVLVTHLSWPLPSYVPTEWGVEAVARMAHVLASRHVAPLAHQAVVLMEGGSGATPIPLSVEPGGCYLALLGVTQGAARTVSLGVRVGSRESVDDRGAGEEGAVVAFCAGEDTGAVAAVDVRGTPLLGWGLAVYRLTDGAWEVPE